MADYVFQHLGISISQQTVSRILRKHRITYKNLTYHYEQMPNMEEIKQFVDMVRGLPAHQLLALDECGFHLNEDPRRGYSLIGKRAIAKRPSFKGEHYTLLLCIKNVDGKGVVHYQLIKGGAKLQAFYNFLEGINLSDTPKKRKELGLPSIREQLSFKNTELIYFPPYTPQLNPTELCFNFLRQQIEKNRPRNLEQLKSFIDKAIEKLNKKDLTEYFRHC
ncbi:6705_t:CDS:2 [Funneliformis geosporum]|nr:6705_t:CDS:2 [Funneliformis geosporum]